MLDGIGMAPVVGAPADLVNAGWYEADGDHLAAGMSVAGALPFVGGAATAAKLGRRGLKAARAGEHAVEDGVDAEARAAADRLTSGLPGPEEIDRLRAVPGDAKQLAENLITAGHVRPLQTDAHHIVAKGHPRAAEARDLLARLGIDIDSADNGVFLPSHKNSIGAGLADGPTKHAGLLSNAYHFQVYQQLREAQTREDAIAILNGVRDDLVTGWRP